MDREQREDVVDLGVASIETKGNDGPPFEQAGQLYGGGLTND